MRIEEIHRLLAENYEVDGWWPYTEAWDVMVGAILTQQTAWSNVVRVMEDMQQCNLNSVMKVAEADIECLMDVVRPCGFFRQKAERLQSLASHLMEAYEGDPMRLLVRDDARQLLLRNKGIGPETADSILLFAAGRPYFVAAAYCGRILVRTGALDDSDYHIVQKKVHETLGRESAVLSEFYALLVEHAKRHCRSRPLCDGCPLERSCAFTEE